MVNKCYYLNSPDAFGRIGRKPIHLLEDEERKKKPELKDLWIDVGASSREEVEAVISVGDVITFQYEFEMLMGERAITHLCNRWFISLKAVTKEAVTLAVDYWGKDGLNNEFEILISGGSLEQDAF